jgi:hypothetical protein
MVKQYMELINGEWVERDYPTKFWIDTMLLARLKNLKKIQKKGWDGVLIVDGKERSGKSTLAMVCGWYLSNGNIGIHNFAAGIEDCAKKIAELPDGSVLIVDEGSLMFSGRDSMGKQQRKLIKILDVVGQKNMIFIIALPCFFDLNKTIAVRRSLFLMHVYPDENYNRGRYAIWGEKSKAKLFHYGKKNFDSYSQPKAEHIGDYVRFEPPFYKEYLEIIKRKSMNEVLKDAYTSKFVDERLLIGMFVYIATKKFKISQEMLAKELEIPQKTLSSYKIGYEKVLNSRENGLFSPLGGEKLLKPDKVLDDYAETKTE